MGREGGGEGRERTGQVLQGLVDQGENWGFYPGEVEPTGLWAEEGGT